MSTPYKVARQYLITNPIAIQKLGEVKSASPAFFEPYKIEFGSGDNNAEMRVNVKGATESGVVHVTLKQKGEIWEITGATLRLSNGAQVNLMQ